MERETKFRGQRIDNKEWEYGHFVKLMNGVSYIIVDLRPKANHELWIPVVDETVGQFPGLSTQYDMQVYEGDKVSFSIFDHNGSDTQHEGYVVYSGSRFVVSNNPDGSMNGTDGPFDLDWVLAQDDEAKVIGNVHEHPHLLKTTK
jgi:uncharacterized phage protein (TIGR01671 family)